MTSLYRIETSELTCFFSINNATRELVQDDDFHRTRTILVQTRGKCDICFDRGLYRCRDTLNFGYVTNTNNGLFLFINVDNVFPEYVMFPAKLHDDKNRRMYEMFQQHLLCFKCKGEYPKNKK
jgi:hypothetical protein